MKNLSFVLMAVFGLVMTAPAQNNQYASAADSDPEARAVLDKLRKKYDSYHSMQAEFSLSIELPEQPAEIQQGTLSRQGEKYRLKMAQQEIISDGETLYLILHNNKEVQINNLPEEEEDQSILSPQSLFRLYDSDKFVYFLANEMDRNGTVVQQIEMKSLDRQADYSKLRMEVNKPKNEVMNLTAFAKDGSRYTFTLEKVIPNKSFPAEFFAFKKSEYPDYYVEDLRF